MTLFSYSTVIDNGHSLITIIPKSVVRTTGLKKGDELKWDFESIGDEEIKKITIMKCKGRDE